ncbi:MAG: nitroreductase [Candidatus Brachytrichaceae bacterium NZ_4S206]|jgi:nitroreductase
MNDTTHILLNLIRERRSYTLKELSSAPVNLDDVKLMLEAARWAPTHGMTEPWRFCVFAGESRAALGERFAEAYRLLTPPEKYDPKAEQAQRERPFAAPVWISLGMLRTGHDKMPEWEDLASVAIAAQHIHLVAHSLGYACKWTSGDIVRHESLFDLVGLRPPSKLLGFLFVGRPADGVVPRASRSPIEDKVIWRT